jgi:hypothetical protein
MGYLRLILISHPFLWQHEPDYDIFSKCSLLPQTAAMFQLVLIEKTGNLAAVQRQLGHTNPAYSMQYTRITDEELGNALEDR